MSGKPKWRGVWRRLRRAGRAWVRAERRDSRDAIAAWLSRRPAQAGEAGCRRPGVANEGASQPGAPNASRGWIWSSQGVT
jgi:hypothetical protein